MMNWSLLLFCLLLANPICVAAPPTADNAPGEVPAELTLPPNHHVPRLGRQFAGKLSSNQLAELKGKYLAKAKWNKGGTDLFRLATLPTNVEFPHFYAAVLDDMIRVAIQDEKIFLTEIKKVLGSELLFMYRAFLTALENNLEFRIPTSHESDPDTQRLYRELKGKAPKGGEVMVPEGFAHLRLFAEFFTWLQGTDTRRPRTLIDYCLFFDEFLRAEKHLVGFLLHVNTFEKNWRRSDGLKSMLRRLAPTGTQACAAALVFTAAVGLNLYAFRGDWSGNEVPRSGEIQKRADKEDLQTEEPPSNDEALNRMYEKLAEELAKKMKP